MKWGSLGAAALIGAVLGGGAMLVAAPVAVGGPERAKIELVVREYNLAHPEIITDALRELQGREVGKVVSANRAAFETPFGGAYMGNPRGDVTLVEFFDYACGYCRASVPTLDRLVKEDPNLRIVFRELPVLGPDSEAAANASLAAARQPGKYNRFHHALFAAGRPVPATLSRVAAANGVTVAPPDPAIREELARNRQLADAIGVTGTPGFIVGERVFPGAVDYEVLKKAVTDARAK